MDIARMSMTQSTQSLQNTANLLLMKKSMEMSQITGNNLVDMMKTVTPPSNHTIDIKV